VAKAENQGLITVIAMMFMVGFGVKAAVFPLFFWLPASYHTPSFRGLGGVCGAADQGRASMR
jgi:multicomponent Na+:H+ antiporter subunit D